jgi:hypothetical protein
MCVTPLVTLSSNALYYSNTTVLFAPITQTPAITTVISTAVDSLKRGLVLTKWR